MKLPNLAEAYVEEKKILQYLLNARHPVGGGKAKFFCGCGVRENDWERFRDILLAHAASNPVAAIRASGKGYGNLYQVDCQVAMPDGSRPCIRSVWEIRGDDPRPRLITAHPSDE